MSELGHFIVVEGLEGAGKSTAMTTVQTFLEAHVSSFVTTREPGGSPVGEAIRHMIKHTPSNESIDPRAELLLLYASRVQLVERVIKPALQGGVSVLADRFELSTFAYQGGGRGIDLQMIEMISAFCLQGFTPDLILFLDVDPAKGLQRAHLRGAADRIEQESLEFFKAVNNAYHAKIRTMKHVVVIDANQSIEHVQQAITSALTQYFASRQAK
jgi:dTMP kinase